MNKLMNFDHIKFGNVRVVENDGELWFVGKDVAEALSYSRPTKAIKDHVDDEDKDEIPIRDSIGRMQNTAVINESGLFSLIFSSRLPESKEFKRWVTSEVLPQIRRTGGYIPLSEQDNEKIINEKAAQIAQRTIEDCEEFKKDIAFSRAYQKSDENVLFRVFAKLISDDTHTIGEKALFTWFRAKKFLMLNNEPYQRYIDMGLLVYSVWKMDTYNGYRFDSITLITPKGQKYFFEKIQEEIKNGSFYI
jgi:anti-repressor protein